MGGENGVGALTLRVEWRREELAAGFVAAAPLADAVFAVEDPLVLFIVLNYHTMSNCCCCCCVGVATHCFALASKRSEGTKLVY